MTSRDNTVHLLAEIDDDELAWRMMKAANIDVPGVVSVNDIIPGKLAMKYIEEDNPTRAWRWREMSKAAVTYILEQLSNAAEKKH